MTKPVFLASAILLLVTACFQDHDEFDNSIEDAPVFIAVTEGPEVRVFADDNLHVLWNTNDRISVFNRTTVNQEYRFVGEEGQNTGTFELVSAQESGGGSNSLDLVYAVYPFSESTVISNSGTIEVVLPAKQAYRKNSFGLGANTMIAASIDNELIFKNLCGYLLVSLYGEDVNVKSVSIKGNSNEPIAGPASVVARVNLSPILQFDESMSNNEISMSFDTPVTLGVSEKSATEFWFVIPPTSFEYGITLTVIDDKDRVFVKNAISPLEIKRNTLVRTTGLLVVPEHQGGNKREIASMKLYVPGPLGENTIDFQFDYQDGHLNKVTSVFNSTSPLMTSYYSYSEGTISITGGYSTSSCLITLDNGYKPVTITREMDDIRKKWAFTYTEDKLTNCMSDYWSTSLVWEGEDIVRMEEVKNSYKKQTSFTYTSYENKENLDLSYYFFKYFMDEYNFGEDDYPECVILFPGCSSKHLLKSISNDDESHSLLYELDDDGYVSSITFYEKGNYLGRAIINH